MITVSTDLARRLARAKAALDHVEATGDTRFISLYTYDLNQAARALADELISNRHHETESGHPRERLVAVMYNPMIYESAFEVVSLHRTRRGAVTAMRRLKADCPYDGFNAYRCGVFGVEGC